MSTSVAPRMTAAEYLAWEREQPERHHFLRGDVFAMAGGTPRHNALCMRIGVRLAGALGNGPCEVFSSDQRVALQEGQHYVYPDATVVCGRVQLLSGTKDVLTNPTIVVEGLSKSTEAYDRGLKWDGYQALPSVTDYLLVSQASPRIEHYRREAGGEWHYRAAVAGGVVTLSNGAVIEVDAVFRGAFEIEGE